MFYKKFNTIFVLCFFHTVKIYRFLSIYPLNFWRVIFLLYICRLLRPYKLLIILF